MTVEACAPLDIQLVIGLGNGLRPRELGDLPGNPLALSYVPQFQLLERAQPMVTQAGMNSTLECLSQGVPLVAIPITHDQLKIHSSHDSVVFWTGVIPASRVSALRAR